MKILSTTYSGAVAPGLRVSRGALVRLLVVCIFLFRTLSTGFAGWVKWDRSSDRIVSHTDRGAAYPRAKRLSNGEILLGYHHSGSWGEYGSWVTLRRSRDNGKTWYHTQDVERPDSRLYWGYSNLDFIELSPGKLLFVTAARGRGPDGDDMTRVECKRSALRIRFSNDYGKTWGKPKTVVQGRGRVWEPSLVQLPTGELEIYYANEAWATKGRKGFPQQIEMIRSLDQGKTWSKPVIISEARGTRIGMPAAAVLESGQVACVEEAVGDKTSPWVVRTHAGVRGERYLAQNEYGFGSAPFLLMRPGEGTLLTYHSLIKKEAAPENAPVPWMFQDIWIQKGDAEARNFGPGTRPWPRLNRRTGAFFPSLFMKDAETLVVLGSFRVDSPDGKTSTTVVRWIEGKLKPQKAWSWWPFGD